MYTGKQPGQTWPRSPDVDARPVVLVLIEDTIGGLASLLLAAEIAASRQARLHVAHVIAPHGWWGGTAGMPVPTAMLDEADRADADELRDRIGDVLALGPPVEWTFTWSRGVVHDIVTRLVGEISPIAVVVGERRRPWLWMHRSMARWLIGRPNIQAVVVPA
jgi:hypothetical protein